MAPWNSSPRKDMHMTPGASTGCTDPNLKERKLSKVKQI